MENNFESAVSSPPLPVIPLSGHISEPTSFPLSIETQTPPYGSATSTPSPDEAPELRELTPPAGTPIASHYSFDMADSRATSPDLIYLLGNQPVMIRTLRVMGLVPPQYVITSYRFRLFPLFPLPYYYPILVLSMITHRLTCFNCVWLCPTSWYQLCDRLSI